MAWFLAFALVFEGFLIYKAFYAASALMNVIAFIMLIPTTLTLLKLLFVVGLTAVSALLGWFGPATDSSLMDTQEQDDSDEEEVSSTRKWKLSMERDDGLSDLTDPLNPLSPLSPLSPLNPMNDHHHNHHGSMF